MGNYETQSHGPELHKLNVDGSRLPQEVIGKHFYEPSLGSFLFAFFYAKGRYIV